MPKKAAVVVDNWKVPIFKKHLDAAGLKYERPLLFTHMTMLLKVEYEWVHKLQLVIVAARAECDERKKTNTICQCGCYSGGCARPDGCRCDKTCPCGAARSESMKGN